MGLAMASGLNTYLPLLLLSLFARYGNVVHISPKFHWLISDQTIVVLSILVLCEVLADKFPGMDHVWDFTHTLLRPVAGALAAGATVSTDNVFEMALAMLLGGSLATATHASKATVRLVSTTKSLGFANPILSIVEDITSLVATLFAIFVPWLMVIIAVLFMIALIFLGPPVWRTLRFNLSAVGGGLSWLWGKITGSAPPRELNQSVLGIDPGRLRRLRANLKESEELLGALEGWRRTGWGPRRMWLLITAQNLVLADRKLLGGFKTEAVAFSDIQLVRERGSLLISRLEIMTRRKADIILMLPRPQAAFAPLATQRLSELAGLGRDPSASPQPRLVTATP